MDIFVKMDRSGRLVLPKKFRDTFRTREFNVNLENNERIVLIPVKSTDEMFGSMRDLDLEGFAREHKRER